MEDVGVNGLLDMFCFLPRAVFFVHVLDTQPPRHPIQSEAQLVDVD